MVLRGGKRMWVRSPLSFKLTREQAIQDIRNWSRSRTRPTCRRKQNSARRSIEFDSAIRRWLGLDGVAGESWRSQFSRAGLNCARGHSEKHATPRSNSQRLHASVAAWPVPNTMKCPPRAGAGETLSAAYQNVNDLTIASCSSAERAPHAPGARARRIGERDRKS